MIRLLAGTVTDIESDAVTIVVGGVGYQVYTPHPTAFTSGDKVTVHTHHAVRETALDLYGFTTKIERTLFELLLKVPKIGPKSGLQVMTQASPQLLIESIARDDAAYLQKMSGVGKKTCENIVTQLHDKLPPELEAKSIGSAPGVLSQSEADAVDALVALGYAPEAARSAVQAHPNKDDTTTVNQLVTQALKQI